MLFDKTKRRQSAGDAMCPATPLREKHSLAHPDVQVRKAAIAPSHMLIYS